jgi:hypothetical protein
VWASYAKVFTVTETNKKLAINASLFVGTIVVGSLLGWGAWLLNNPSQALARPTIEADAHPAPRPATPAKPIAAVQPVVAATPMASAAPIAPAPAPRAGPTQSLQNYRNATPEQQQQAIQNLATLAQRSQDPRMQQLAAQAQTPEGQQQLREQANALLQQFRNGGQGAQGFGNRNPGGQRPTGAAPGGFAGANAANPPLPANVATIEDDSADGG